MNTPLLMAARAALARTAESALETLAAALRDGVSVPDIRAAIIRPLFAAGGPRHVAAVCAEVLEHVPALVALVAGLDGADQMHLVLARTLVDETTASLSGLAGTVHPVEIRNAWAALLVRAVDSADHDAYRPYVGFLFGAGTRDLAAAVAHRFEEIHASPAAGVRALLELFAV